MRSRLLTALLSIVLTSTAFGGYSDHPLTAQQGAGGGGFGGGGIGGGGMGGGGMRAGDEQLQEVFPQRQNGDVTDRERWEFKSMILTPGDRVEWKVSGKKGQTVFLTVTSTVFDPALAILDKNDKQLAFNDDQQDGDQSPYLSFYFPDDAEYKIIVKNYHSTAGGAFKLFSWFTPTISLNLGRTSQPLKSLPFESEAGEQIYRIQAKKGTIYGVEAPLFTSQFIRNFSFFIRLIGPTGLAKQDYEILPFPGQHLVFEAKADGDYFIGYSRWYGGAGTEDRLNLTTNLVNAKIVPVKQQSDTSVSLEPHEFALVQFPVNNKDIVRTRVMSSGFCEQFVHLRPKDLSPGETRRPMNDDGFRAFPALLSSGDDVVRLFGDKGDVRVMLHTDEKPSVVHVQCTNELPDLKDGGSASEVQLGQSQFHIVQVEKGETLTLSATGTTLEPDLTMVSSSGQANKYLDRQTHHPVAKLHFTEKERYLLVSGAAGGGGAGVMSIHLQRAHPKQISVGQVIKGDPSDQVMNNFSITLAKGQCYQLLVQGPNYELEVTDSDGKDLPIEANGTLRGVRFIYFTPTNGGLCRIRLPEIGPETIFKIVPVTPPSVGN